MKTLIAVLLVALFVSAAGAEPRYRSERDTNYILRRQEAYQVQGTPTKRLIIGKREIDGYRLPNGGTIWYERDNVVGIGR
jgi:hypothetical protein